MYSIAILLSTAAPNAPPTKRPNKDPMPSHRPSPEQYAAMISAAAASGQPLPRHHVSFFFEFIGWKMRSS